MPAMYEFLRRLLFCLPPEVAHRVALTSLQALSYTMPDPKLSLPCKVMGLDFPNPVGIAAGLDKNAEYLKALASMGPGFVEVGSITLQARRGNPKPRLFRLPSQQALINRIGLANHGLAEILPRLERANFPGILGVNIAKEASAETAEAVLVGYQQALSQVYPVADYVTFNLSCPHEPGLRGLQFGADLERLLAGLKSTQSKLTHQYDRYVPIVIKLSPELTSEEIAQIAEQLIIYSIDGVIATNTTNQRPLVKGLIHSDEVGGLSGKPLFIDSTAVVRELSQRLSNKIPIIAVGGIMSGEDAKQKLEAGASLIQIYTGLIYQGPCLIRNIIQVLTTK